MRVLAHRLTMAAALLGACANPPAGDDPTRDAGVFATPADAAPGSSPAPDDSPDSPADARSPADAAHPLEPDAEGDDSADAEPARPSDAALEPRSGCGRPAGPNDRVFTLEHQGRTRSFHVHTPVGYDPERPTPVVVNFHGRATTAQQQMLITGLLPIADASGFIAVHPEGIGQTWNAGLCCGEAQTQGVDDVGFTRALLDRLADELCVDPGRVYAMGLSNGGFMAHRVACELADRFAAIGSVAGPSATFTCEPVRPVAVQHFHGTADMIVPYDGFAGQVSAPATIDGWVTRNGCAPGATTYFTAGVVRCDEFTGCREDATVRLCTIDGGGHQWPGGLTIPLLGENTNDISASHALWAFFSEHARR
ncbi:prolyl oligopeptidase family serine peptidase [Myxococcota bacterium]|nr:prolyl oligopeptidase family serine peptidase [Myxococcota bacterium]